MEEHAVSMFKTEDGDIYLYNTGSYLPDYIASYFKRH
jgi:hypothetical protein